MVLRDGPIRRTRRLSKAGDFWFYDRFFGEWQGSVDDYRKQSPSFFFFFAAQHYHLGS